MHNATRREGFVGTSLEEPRDQILESAPTFPSPGDLVVEGLTDAEEATFLAAVGESRGEPIATPAGPP
jgi:hypothetical protein